ncbi:aminodeoxychorismate synthase component I [Rhodococcus sp. T2V]|nr:aminodeoxychorismate synthase component I [Rhodococcus sp. T2V]
MERANTASARFDDLVAGTALGFDSIEREIVAWRPEDVADALDDVQRLSDEGYWAFGFVTYEAASALDAELPTVPSEPGLPLVWFGIANEPVKIPPVRPAESRRNRSVSWTPDWDEQQHKRAIDFVRAHIAAGETYQCNVTTRFTTQFVGDSAELYRDLALSQKGRYNAFLEIGGYTVASASPELFFELQGSQLRMKPMKGTARRGRTRSEDNLAVARLTASPKEQAENIMIVDLVRNDLARIARLGTVSVPALLRAERYETVHQLTSDVTAELDDAQMPLSQIFRALFPCGSITGAPKQRTMELIKKIEDGPRGIYCGAIGIVAPANAGFRARFSVAIRTVVVDRSTGAATYGAGGGITWNSDAASEYAEVLTKAQILQSRPEDFHLIETMRHEGHGVVKSLDAHLRRAEDSAHYFGFAYDSGLIRRSLEAHLTHLESASRVRIMLFRNGHVEIDETALPRPDSRPLKLALHPDPIDTATCWSRHKTSLRTPYTRRLESMPQFDDVVLTNEAGEVMETCTGNLAVLVDGRWVTPPLESGCLPGVERQRLLDEGTLSELAMTVEQLNNAASVAVINSLQGWCTAQFVDAQVRPQSPSAGSDLSSTAGEQRLDAARR